MCSGVSSSELEEEELIADLERVNFGGAIFNGVGFAGVDLVLEGVGLEGVDAEGVGFDGVGFDFGFEGVAFGDAGLTDGDFAGVLLAGVDGGGKAALGGTGLEELDLAGVGLAADDLDGVGFDETVLEVAVLGGTDTGGDGASTGAWPPFRNCCARSLTLGNMLL